MRSSLTCCTDLKPAPRFPAWFQATFPMVLMLNDCWWIGCRAPRPLPSQILPADVRAYYSSNLPRQGSFSQVTNTTISLLILAGSLGFSDWSRPPPGSKALGDAGSARTMMRNGTQVLLSSPDPLPSLRGFSGGALAQPPSLHFTQFSGKQWIRGGYGGAACFAEMWMN